MGVETDTQTHTHSVPLLLLPVCLLSDSLSLLALCFLIKLQWHIYCEIRSDAVCRNCICTPCFFVKQSTSQTLKLYRQRPNNCTSVDSQCQTHTLVNPVSFSGWNSNETAVFFCHSQSSRAGVNNRSLTHTCSLTLPLLWCSIFSDWWDHPTRGFPPLLHPFPFFCLHITANHVLPVCLGWTVQPPLSSFLFVHLFKHSFCIKHLWFHLHLLLPHHRDAGFYFHASISPVFPSFPLLSHANIYMLGWFAQFHLSHCKAFLPSERWRSCTCLQTHSSPMRRKSRWTGLQEKEQIKVTNRCGYIPNTRQDWLKCPYVVCVCVYVCEYKMSVRQHELRTVRITRSVSNEEAGEGKAGAVNTQGINKRKAMKKNKKQTDHMSCQSLSSSLTCPEVSASVVHICPLRCPWEGWWQTAGRSPRWRPGSASRPGPCRWASHSSPGTPRLSCHPQRWTCWRGWDWICFLEGEKKRGKKLQI